MAVMVKWLTRQIVALVCVGSIPTNRPIYVIQSLYVRDFLMYKNIYFFYKNKNFFNTFYLNCDITLL